MRGSYTSSSQGELFIFTYSTLDWLKEYLLDCNRNLYHNNNFMKKIFISIFAITTLLMSFTGTSSANYSYNNSAHITSVSYSWNNKIIRFSDGRIRTESGNISRSSSYRNSSNQSYSRTYNLRNSYNNYNNSNNYNRYSNNSYNNNNRFNNNSYSNTRYDSNGYPRY